MESLDKISSSAQSIPTPDSGNLGVDAVQTIDNKIDSADNLQADNLEGSLAMKEVGDSKELEPSQKVQALKNLQEEELVISSDMKRVGELSVRERQEMSDTRKSLGMEPLSAEEPLLVEKQLEELKIKQNELEQQKEALLQEEMREVLEENVTGTFEIFHKLPPEVFETVLVTGKIPLMYRVLSFVLGIPQIEEEFVIILAQAYKKGITKIYDISREFPKFDALREQMKPAIIEVASERVLEEPEQKQIEDVKEEQNVIENGETTKEITDNEPKQVAETSGADAGSSPAGGGPSSAVPEGAAR